MENSTKNLEELRQERETLLKNCSDINNIIVELMSEVLELNGMSFSLISQIEKMKSSKKAMFGFGQSRKLKATIAKHEQCLSQVNKKTTRIGVLTALLNEEKRRLQKCEEAIKEAIECSKQDGKTKKKSSSTSPKENQMGE